MRIRAAVLHEVGSPFRIEELDLAPPRAGEVLVRIGASGVCHSDWHLRTGDTRHPLPVVVGHEGAGTVVEVGPGVTGLEAGDLVALNWAPSCGRCFYCLRDRPSLCSEYLDAIWSGTLLDGTTRLTVPGGLGAEPRPVYHYSSLACFADHTVVPAVCCVRLPVDVPVEIAALIGCAVTTGVGAVLRTTRIEPGTSVAIYGAGGVGLSCVLGARLAGAARVIVVDRAPEKAAIARELGATDVVAAGPDALDAIRELTGGRGADHVFEAVGSPAVQAECLHAARPGGTIVLVGLSPMGSSTDLPGALITRQEKTVVGSYYGSANAARDFPLYAELYLQGQLALDRLVTRTYPLEAINEAYDDMLAGRVARGVIVP